MAENVDNLELHVVGATCDSSALGSEPRFGKFSTGPALPKASLDRMAAKPENFTKAGFFFGACRTPHDSKRQCLGLRGSKQGALSEGRRSRSVCEEPTRTSKWFDQGMAHPIRALGRRIASLGGTQS